MLEWALLFFLVAIVAWAFGMRGTAYTAASIGRFLVMLFVFFILLFVIMAVFGVHLFA